MPFDQGNSELTSYRVEKPVTDDVLRVLIALRELHSEPARWCSTGPGERGSSWCIALGVRHVVDDLRLSHRAILSEVELALDLALPSPCPSIVAFNERMGTTHAGLMAFYDRAIAARESALESQS